MPHGRNPYLFISQIPVHLGNVQVYESFGYVYHLKVIDRVKVAALLALQPVGVLAVQVAKETSAVSARHLRGKLTSVCGLAATVPFSGESF